ncbi:hypothetical protein [Acetivibrio clariflavus]|uniref:Uncharacterized protein n=1 Tax=Acetivibrio clariflavus (strain DSM 19732 / NBRC 101661 / EBR45) TaxID=720554 RepID=G8M2V7_ACECE|nr:hypothetical protein [Acetivibrio clariflavus]AEV68221.1 hypothetical protein Clocl_1585 [Acetivibrio clariflavus DSM 19732]
MSVGKRIISAMLIAAVMVQIFCVSNVLTVSANKILTKKMMLLTKRKVLSILYIKTLFPKRKLKI